MMKKNQRILISYLVMLGSVFSLIACTTTGIDSESEVSKSVDTIPANQPLRRPAVSSEDVKGDADVQKALQSVHSEAATDAQESRIMQAQDASEKLFSLSENKNPHIHSSYAQALLSSEIMNGTEVVSVLKLAQSLIASSNQLETLLNSNEGFEYSPLLTTISISNRVYAEGLTLVLSKLFNSQSAEGRAVVQLLLKGRDIASGALDLQAARESAGEMRLLCEILEDKRASTAEAAFVEMKKGFSKAEDTSTGLIPQLPVAPNLSKQELGELAVKLKYSTAALTPKELAWARAEISGLLYRVQTGQEKLYRYPRKNQAFSSASHDLDSEELEYNVNALEAGKVPFLAQRLLLNQIVRVGNADLEKMSSFTTSWQLDQFFTQDLGWTKRPIATIHAFEYSNAGFTNPIVVGAEERFTTQAMADIQDALKRGKEYISRGAYPYWFAEVSNFSELYRHADKSTWVVTENQQLKIVSFQQRHSKVELVVPLNEWSEMAAPYTDEERLGILDAFLFDRSYVTPEAAKRIKKMSQQPPEHN